MSGKDERRLPPVIEVDAVIHEPGRLAIMAHLYVLDSADYLFLKGQTGMSWGNLSSHLAKLEEAGYVEMVKKFVDKKPRTTIRLTKKGREAFTHYSSKMRLLFEKLPEKP